MKLIKIIAVGIILIVPVCIYLFLEFFGENQYQIPVYHQETDSLSRQFCSRFEKPHFVNLTNYQSSESMTLDGSIYVINPILDKCLNCPPNLNEINRVINKHKGLQVVNIYGTQVTSIDDQYSLNSSFFNYPVHIVDLISILRCELVIDIMEDTSIAALNKDNQFVLVDTRGRIRGYYNKGDREEVDRLIVEISILSEER